MVKHLSLLLRDVSVEIVTELLVGEVLEGSVATGAVEVQLVESAAIAEKFEGELLRDLEVDQVHVDRV